MWQPSTTRATLFLFFVLDEEIKSLDGDSGQGLLNVPYNGTSSSTSFDLEKAGTRIQQLAASDSDEFDSNCVENQKESPVCEYF